MKKVDDDGKLESSILFSYLRFPISKLTLVDKLKLFKKFGYFK